MPRKTKEQLYQEEDDRNEAIALAIGDTLIGRINDEILNSKQKDLPITITIFNEDLVRIKPVLSVNAKLKLSRWGIR